MAVKLNTHAQRDNAEQRQCVTPTVRDNQIFNDTEGAAGNISTADALSQLDPGKQTGAVTTSRAFAESRKEVKYAGHPHTPTRVFVTDAQAVEENP